MDNFPACWVFFQRLQITLKNPQKYINKNNYLFFYLLGQSTSEPTDLDLSFQFQSKIGKSLYFVFGACEEVRSFDKHHLIFKEYKYEASRLLCQNLKLTLSKTIKEENKTATNAIRSWEKDFFKFYFKEPSINDMSNEILIIYKKMIHSKSIMRAWNL